MGIMENIGATIATKYGTVTEGKHAGTVVALGNDPLTKAGFTHTFSQIIFLDGTVEKGRYNINESFTGVKIIEETAKGYKILGVFKDDEHFILELELKKDDTMAVGLIKTFLGTKKDKPEDKAENKYRPLKVFTLSFIDKLSPDTAEFLIALYEKNGILDELNNKLLNKRIEQFQN